LGGDAIVRLGLKPAKRYQRAQLICNLESGACNPQPIVSLKEKLNWTIKTNERLHAKVYLFDDVAIVGSANPSANGLALQDTEVNSWHEVCVVVSQRQQIKELRQWFEKIFKQSGSITPARLKVAQDQWSRRRKNTADILKSSKKSLKELVESEGAESILESTQIWIYKDSNVSPESSEYNSIQKRAMPILTDEPYEVGDNPRTYSYDVVIDCAYEKGRNGAIRVSPTQFRLYPQLARRLAKGSSKGDWTLPASELGKRSAEASLLDDRSVKWLRSMVAKIVKRKGEWHGTLGKLITDTHDLP
jgi:hypothetical protein